MKRLEPRAVTERLEAVLQAYKHGTAKMDNLAVSRQALPCHAKLTTMHSCIFPVAS